MPVREKKILSFRYLWKIFVYAMDLAFVILSFSVAVDLYRISDPEKGKIYVGLITGAGKMAADNVMLQFAKLIALLCLVAFAGLLITLSHLFLNELSVRENAEHLMFAMGYRKVDILFYEEIYVLFDLLLAYLAAVLLSTLFGGLAGRVEEIGLLNQTLEQTNCLVPGAFAACAVTAAALVAANTARAVQMTV